MKCGVCMGLRSIPPRFDCMLLVDRLCCQIHEEPPNCSRIIKTEHLCMRLGHCMELDMMLKDGIISITIQHVCNQHVGIFHTSMLTPQVVSWGFTAGGSALGWTLIYWYLSSQMWHCMRIFPQKVNKMGKSDSSHFRGFPSRCIIMLLRGLDLSRYGFQTASHFIPLCEWRISTMKR